MYGYLTEPEFFQNWFEDKRKLQYITCTNETLQIRTRLGYKHHLFHVVEVTSILYHTLVWTVKTIT